MWYCAVVGCPSVYKSTINPKSSIPFHVFPHPIREIERFRQWLAVISSSKLHTMDPILVFKSMRVCRRHFGSDCFNGECRRLLPSAVPSLHLNDERPVALVQPMDTVGNDDPKQLERKLQLKRHNSDDTPAGGLDGTNKRPRLGSSLLLCDPEDAQCPAGDEFVNDIIEFSEEYMEEEEYEESHSLASDSKVSSVCDAEFGLTSFSGLINSDLAGLNQVEILNEPPETLLNDSCATEVRERLPLLKGYEQLVREFVAHDGSNEEDHFDSDVLEGATAKNVINHDKPDETFEKAPLNEEFFQKCRTDFYDCPKNVLAQNVCTRIDPFDACLSRKSLENTQHVFTYKIENEGKPLTNQKSSGRCWVFAALNCIRIPFIKQYNLDEFEFSQAYLFYWDKIERAHYFLNNVIDTAKRGEPVDGRLMSFLLNDPTCDGGQWDMLVNLINKHGLVPKKCFPESYSCEASTRMNSVVKSKLREYAKDLRKLVEDGATDDELEEKIKQQMGEIYNIVGICLGIPPEKFTWEYYDKSKKYLSIGPIRPIDFYEKYVKPYYNVDDKVCLVTDPRSSSLYGRSYTVDCLGNVIGGRPILYNNQPVELLLDLVTKALKFGEAVWFGCEINKRFAAKQGIEDLDIHDFKLVFGVDIQTTMDKADRLLYGDSMMTHAMVFTGVSVDPNSQNPTKFRVENSWGEDRGEKGYLIMTAEWFKEFVFEVVVDRSIVSQDVLDVFDLPPTVLPAWDPMGTLAK
ncbi:bleomycin hydrolase isoform X1 [Anopheles cruzii]|uniref:bleomycin hydrolase isoform X1 n=1 Tax=Anopheles cruzii TaxID=68878 RepID=UPI0022EC458E|nr:bleomycin hydrolase isoform X1 [Anopheles cruzii]